MAGSRFEKHQGDLFIADISDIQTKELQPLMATNWFSLSKNPRHDPIIHEYENYRVLVENTARKGIATIWDHDILIFLISQLVRANEDGSDTSNNIRFTGYEFFQFHQRKWRRGISGKHSYNRLWSALERLHTTHITTTIHPKGDIEEGEAQFYWLPHIEKMKKRSGDEVGYLVSLDQKLYDWISNTKNILTLNPSYFDLTGGLERYIYLWARKSVGTTNQNKEWSERFDLIHEKSASPLSKRHFHRLLRSVIAKNNLPTFFLQEEIGQRGPMLNARMRTFDELPEL